MAIPRKLIFNNIQIKYGPISGVFLIAFALRLFRLGYHDFWYDEIGSVGYALCPWNHWNAPLYGIVLHFWVKIFGVSEFSLRMPSLIFSFLSVVLIFFFGKELFNKKTGLIAASLMALSPFHLWYAQEARDYSMLLFFGLLSSCFLFKALKNPDGKNWIFFLLASLAGLYANYFFIFLFIAQGRYVGMFKKAAFSLKTVICFLLVILWFTLYLPRFLEKFYFVWAGFWLPKPEWKSLLITFENFLLGYSGTPLLYFVMNVLAVASFMCGLIAIRGNKEFKNNFVFCCGLTFIPVMLAFVFSRTFFSVYLDRGLIVFSPYFYLIVSLGVVSAKRAARISLLCILGLLFIIADYRYFTDRMYEPLIHHIGTYIKKPIRPLVRFIEDNLKPNDTLAFTHPAPLNEYGFYSRIKSKSIYQFFDPQFLDSRWQRPVWEDKYRLPFYKINGLEFERLWVVSSNWAKNGTLDEHSQSVKNWLEENFKREFEKEFNGVWVFRYVKN